MEAAVRISPGVGASLPVGTHERRGLPKLERKSPWLGLVRRHGRAEPPRQRLRRREEGPEHRRPTTGGALPDTETGSIVRPARDQRWSSCIAICGNWLACASTDVPACDSTW